MARRGIVPRGLVAGELLRGVAGGWVRVVRVLGGALEGLGAWLFVVGVLRALGLVVLHAPVVGASVVDSEDVEEGVEEEEDAVVEEGEDVD